jgi:hypothetical protein
LAAATVLGIVTIALILGVFALGAHQIMIHGLHQWIGR